MKIAFMIKRQEVTPHLGISYLSAIAKKLGHQTALFSFSEKDALKQIKSYQPDMVAYSVISGEHVPLLAFNKQLKQEIDFYSVFGGPHITFFPETINENEEIDVVSRGEGEVAFEKLLEYLDKHGELPTDSPNLWIRKNGRIYKSSEMTRPDLDNLIYPDRDLFYDKFPFYKHFPMKSFVVNRGCPYVCTYCFNVQFNAMYKSFGQKKIYRTRSPESICDEILEAQKEAPIGCVTFADDVFTINKRWFRDFAKVYRERVNIPYHINTRFDNLNEEIADLLKESNCFRVNVGIEAGSEHIRNNVMQRRMSTETMFKGARLLKERNIEIVSENIIAAPSETYEMALETLQVNTIIQPDVPNFSIFSPFPKLPMTEYAIKNGYFDGDFGKLHSQFYRGSVLDFEPKELNKMLNLRVFSALIIKHPKLLPFIEPLFKIPNNKIFVFIGSMIDAWYKRGMVTKFTKNPFKKVYLAGYLLMHSWR